MLTLIEEGCILLWSTVTLFWIHSFVLTQSCILLLQNLGEVLFQQTIVRTVDNDVSIHTYASKVHCILGTSFLHVLPVLGILSIDNLSNSPVSSGLIIAPWEDKISLCGICAECEGTLWVRSPRPAVTYFQSGLWAPSYLERFHRSPIFSSSTTPSITQLIPKSTPKSAVGSPHTSAHFAPKEIG
jgi:hypothetical protein